MRGYSARKYAQPPHFVCVAAAGPNPSTADHDASERARDLMVIPRLLLRRSRSLVKQAGSRQLLSAISLGDFLRCTRWASTPSEQSGLLQMLRRLQDITSMVVQASPATFQVLRDLIHVDMTAVWCSVMLELLSFERESPPVSDLYVSDSMAGCAVVSQTCAPAKSSIEVTLPELLQYSLWRRYPACRWVIPRHATQEEAK